MIKKSYQFWDFDKKSYQFWDFDKKKLPVLGISIKKGTSFGNLVKKVPVLGISIKKGTSFGNLVKKGTSFGNLVKKGTSFKNLYQKRYQFLKIGNLIVYDLYKSLIFINHDHRVYVNIGEIVEFHHQFFH